MQRSIALPGGRLTYELIQTNRQNLSFRVTPEGEVRLYAPRYFPLREADRAVKEHLPWIQQARLKAEFFRRERDANRPRLTEGARIPLEGALLTLHIEQARRAQVLVSDAEGTLTLRAPDLSEEGLETALRACLIERFRERVSQRLDHYVPLIGRAPGRVTIREQKTRWGSCSSKGNLNFNWLLIFAPPQALDYVVIHELCHLYEFNHSPQFWARVERCQSDYALWRKWLRSGWTAALPVRVGG